MHLKTEQILKKRKIAIKSFDRVKRLLIKFLVFVILNILFVAILLSVYAFFFVNYQLYNISLFYDFAFVFIIFVFGSISFYFIYLYSLRIRSDIKYEEVSPFIICYDEDELVKLFNLVWDIKLIARTRKIIKALKKETIDLNELEKYKLTKN